MRALTVLSTDGPRAIELIDVAVPEPAPGHVLVKVIAAGVNFADVQETRGTYPPGRSAPFLAGQEMVGEITALGDDVTDVRVGDHVYGGGSGAFAEYVTAPAAGLVPVPPGWSPTQTAGLFSNWLTAYVALRTFGRLEAGETVVVHAAAGGVGQAAVRLAHALGATVVGTASSPEKLRLLEGMGVAHVVDYSRGDLVAEVRQRIGDRGADVVIDTVGGDAFRADLQLAANHTGRIVVLGIVAGDAAVSNRELLWDHQVQLLGVNMRALTAHRPDLVQQTAAELFTLMGRHGIRPDEPTAADLADGPAVLARMEARRTTGKLVLVP
jgi:NADPH2:quinone reductase